MSTVEQKMWPWQLRRADALGNRFVRWMQGLFILGVACVFPTAAFASFPYIDEFLKGWLWDMAAPVAKGTIIMTIVLCGVAWASLAERRWAAYIQLRLGPNRVGWYGFLQPIADGLKFLFKEDVILGKVHKGLYLLAPLIIMIPPITVWSVIPFGPGAVGANPYQMASVNIGILVVFALSALGVYGVTLGGWASLSKWSLMGALRAGAQMISYEVSLGLAIAGVLIFAGSFDLVAIVNAQIYGAPLLGFLPPWNIFTQSAGFIVFLVAVFAETNRLPFDLPEAEQELVGGYHTEYSSMKFAMFYLAEYAHMLVACALLPLLFLGGWHVPGLELLNLPDYIAAPIQIFALLAKMFLMLFIFIWVRWTLPRFRYDQLMKLGWLVLLPTALGNLIITATWVALTR